MTPLAESSSPLRINGMKLKNRIALAPLLNMPGCGPPSP